VCQVPLLIWRNEIDDFGLALGFAFEENETLRKWVRAMIGLSTLGFSDNGWLGCLGLCSPRLATPALAKG
jgi:hypothetical protein